MAKDMSDVSLSREATELPASLRANWATNKNGQTLGRKGMETRQRLMDVARELLRDRSPFEITALLITRAAKTAAATFYLYFDDVEDLLYALSAEISDEIEDLFDQGRLLRDPDRLYEEAAQFVKAYNAVWDRHSDILLYRNLEADRGNPRFNNLLTEASIPILNALAERIMAAYPQDQRPRRAVVYAEAIVFFVALERMAASAHQYPEEGLNSAVLIEGQARVLARMLEKRAAA
ncbi:hypothetical protein BH10PSE13_BH10PSE13_20200 [soil metagenome]